MKNIFKLSFLLMTITLFVVGCGSSNNNNNDNNSVTTLTGVYSGYTQDTNGDKVSFRVFANNNTAIAQVLDFNDTQTVLQASKLTEEVVEFDGYDCQHSSDNLKCNDIVIEPLPLESITLATLDGTYKKVDSSHNVWTMTVSSGNVDISNDVDSCTLTGEVSVVLNSTVPFFDLTASGCTENGNYKGYAESDTVSSPDDTLNLLIPNFTNISSNWTK